MRDVFSGFDDKIIIDTWKKRFGVFPHCRRIVDDVQRHKIEKGIAMVEQRGGGDDAIRLAVDQQSEVAEMPVHVVNKRIKDNHVVERFDKFFPKRFIEFSDGFHAAPRDEPSNRHIA